MIPVQESATTGVRTAPPKWWRRCWLFWRRWPTWVGYAAALWSLTYGMLGVYWWLGGAGFPYSLRTDPAAEEMLLGGVSAETGAPVIAVLGSTGAAVAVLLARMQPRGMAGAVALGFAWSTVAALLLVVSDYRVLVYVAYAPMLLIGPFFGLVPRVGLSEALPWPVVHQYLCIGGALLWAAAAVAYRRRYRDACGDCGRAGALSAWTTPEAAARWGRWAAYIAVAVPIFYAITRWAWFLGFPLGITEEFLREGQEIGLWSRGMVLGSMGVGGAVLTLGLTQRWGERFPRWMVGLAGKRVPPMMAVVPASLVAVLVTVAGKMFIRRATLGDSVVRGSLTWDNWATVGPELLWPLWGAALGAAALAYYYRRRGACRHCGRG